MGIDIGSGPYHVHSSPWRLAGEKKFHSYNHKTTIWVSHEYYLNPEYIGKNKTKFKKNIFLKFYFIFSNMGQEGF